MPKSEFAISLEWELQDAFLKEAAAEQRTAPEIVGELLEAYVRERRETRAYELFLARKVEIARAQREAGQGTSHESAESEFEVFRADLARRAAHGRL